MALKKDLNVGIFAVDKEQRIRSTTIINKDIKKMDEKVRVSDELSHDIEKKYLQVIE